MKLDKNTNILIVGLGLLGGSYARALTKKGFSVKCITRSQSSVDYALSEGIISFGTTVPEPELIGAADLAVFALYPHVFVEWMEKYGKYLKKGAVITDVTGVKKCIVEKIQDMLPEGVEFIAAHPMAGREVYGVQNSDDSIFKEANYIVTPTEKNTPEAVRLCKDLGHTLGFAHVAELTPEAHDDMIAYLSQLTHCIAVALMTSSDVPKLKEYTGDSFRDLTRIARINEDMWSELFLLNKKSLISMIDEFSGELYRMRTYIADDNVEKLKEMMRISTERRAAFDKTKMIEE
ncbi:MAG: prephenate dehydrogenase [Clostridia bacterium]|nr:prephenate dehydrogenase [Clostridia bacterium]